MRRILVCGIAAGLALAAKHSAIFLLPVWLVLALMEFFTPETTARSKWGRRALRMAISLHSAIKAKNRPAVALSEMRDQ